MQLISYVASVMLDCASMRNEIVSIPTTESVGIRIMLHIKLCACFDQIWGKYSFFLGKFTLL